ncbi:MAG TPA: BamA/TamA family outer membrane protein, partial [Luteolibacter sp.]
PWFLDRQLALGGELFFRDANYFSDNYDQSNVGASVFLRRPLGPKGSIKLDYRLEQIGIDVDKSVPAASEFWLEDGDYLRSALGLTYIYDSRDSNMLPREGEKIEIGTTLAGLGGDVQTFTVSAQGQKYWNLWRDSIFSLNGELAFVDNAGGDRVPIFERMFLGGGRTLRGFEFRDVGPRDAATNDVIGGKSLGFLSAEYTVPIIENIRAAVFYDTGFVNDGAWDPSPSDLYSDVGFGVRLKLPISPLPLALDYAIPVSSPDDEADKGGQFNFYLNYTY